MLASELDPPTQTPSVIASAKTHHAQSGGFRRRSQLNSKAAKGVSAVNRRYCIQRLIILRKLAPVQAICQLVEVRCHQI